MRCLHKFYFNFVESKQKKMENLSVSNSCVNCSNINELKKCSVHEIIVNEKFTCEEFSLSDN